MTLALDRLQDGHAITNGECPLMVGIEAWSKSTFGKLECSGFDEADTFTCPKLGVGQPTSSSWEMTDVTSLHSPHTTFALTG